MADAQRISSSQVRIERLAAPPSGADLRGLAHLLVDAVESGAAISFLPPLSLDEAEAWWRSATAPARPGTVTVVARSGDEMAGCVQLYPSWAPNQPHRADIGKLMVRRDHRGAGLGSRLMDAIEAEAERAGYRLLVLDTRRGDAAERLYERLGWHRVGVIPDYAYSADGTLHDTVVFFKRVGAWSGEAAE